jgi:regulator of RNase E activity RraA
MRTGKDRVRVEQYGGAVSIGGIRVRPGDVLYGDADGVVVIPWERLTEVTDIAHGIVRAEDEIRQIVEGGSSLVEARARLGYHRLQTKTRP